MDSYNFHFERMSNVDLHTLSLPVSRLSPAKSNSSIVDQFAHHHQHGKGDSAYSSFSGGSTAPDYPSPLLPDDLQSSSFNHFADLKHVKSIYPHTHVLHSDSKTMDQLYRSVEAISQQYRNNTSTNVNHHNSNDSFHNNNKVQSDKEMALGAPPQSSQSPPHPPPVPTRLDSFITTKNLENTRVHHHSTEFKPQQPLPQQQPRPYNRRHLQQHSLTSQSQEKANPDTCNSSFSSEPLYSVWRGSQHQQPQAQQPPGYHPHLQSNEQSQILSNPGYLSIMDNKAASEHQKLKNMQSGSPPRGISHSECLIPRQVSTSGGCNEDQHSKYSSSFESQRKRAHSAHDWLGSEPSQAATPSSIGQSFINSSIQHKGQFYFVTGVCKLSDAGIRSSSVSVCGSDAGSVSSTVLEKHHVREKERSHSTMENLFRPLHERPCTSSGTISDEREFFLSVSQGKDPSSRSHDQENHRPAFISMQSSQSFEDDVIQSREIGRHTANNPIFYCGPDKNGLPHSPTQNKEVTSLMNNDQPNHFKKEDHAKRGKRQPLGDVASEKINKETTPILYHLTEANRAVLQPKKDADISIKGNETVRNRIGHGDVLVNKNERPPKGDTSKNDQGDTISVACNTLDESFKKYYKEKLKDAQSKVLRETSFKRRDLQLSWPHRIRQKSDLRPTVIHSFSPSQDSETSTDTLPPSVTSEETEQWSIKEEVRENQMEMDIETEGKENGRPANVAQPQVGRCGGRKRLTPEQKKMCYSEPEKLNHLGGTPSHSACRSFGNESDNVFVAESEHQGEQGLVAARRKMFETRGRALSASSTSKTNLKHLQHKALVEYMERKTGQKVAEPQTPAPQLPPPTRQRHSLGEKPFDWGPKTVSGNHEGKNIKKKLHRPQSAGRILDSSTSSIRYAQFFSEQTCSGPLSGKSNQPRWRESQGPQGKSASVENLLDQPDPPSFYRNRSTSTPHAFQGLQAHEYSRDPFPFNPVETCSSQKNTTDDSLANPVSEGKQYVRAVAQRGKSMEELGASKLVRQSALSKSSEQLDQRCRHSTGPGGSELDKRSFSFIAEVRDAQGLERERQKQDLTEKAEEEPEIVGQTSPQGRIQNQAQKMPPLKQNSEPREDASESTRCTTRSTSPASCSSSWARVQFGPPESYDPVPDKFRPSNETSSNPPSPRGLDTSEREITPTSSSPAQPKLPCENRPCFSRVSASPSVAGSEREQSLDEPSDDTPTPDSDDEASLSCGITTDPSLCIPPPEEDIKEEVQNAAMTDRGSEDESSSSVSQTQTSDTSVFPCTFVSEAAVSHQRDEETNPESVDEKSEENQESEERGAPGGDKENLEEPNEKPQWEELVESVVNADQSLARVLYPLTNRKTALMLMEQLLSEDTLLMEEHYKKKQEQGGTAESTDTVKEVESSHCVSSSEAQDPALQSKTDIAEKKHLLVSCIKEHLNSLGEMRGTLQSEILENTAQGEALELLVQECCLPIELERYKLFIGDLERVVSLLLCLSARLARVQNALSTVDHDTDAEEKQSLDSRHRLLCKQREDAKDLKDNLDRRENLVSTFLSRQLSSVQLQDYRRFIQTKASLLIRQKDLEEKQRLGEEQLEALSNSLNL